MEAYIPVDTTNLSPHPRCYLLFFSFPSSHKLTKKKTNILLPVHSPPMMRQPTGSSAEGMLFLTRDCSSLLLRGGGGAGGGGRRTEEGRRDRSEMPCRPPLARFTLNPFLSVAANSSPPPPRFIL